MFHTEDEFQDRMDAEPENHALKLVFADWLQEHNDRRAEGYRAIARHKLVLWDDGPTHGFCISHDREDSALYHGNPNHPRGNFMPHWWFALVPRERYHKSNDYWIYVGKPSRRRDVEDLIAEFYSPAAEEEHAKPKKPGVVPKGPRPKKARANRRRA